MPNNDISFCIPFLHVMCRDGSKGVWSHCHILNVEMVSWCTNDWLWCKNISYTSLSVKIVWVFGTCQYQFENTLTINGIVCQACKLMQDWTTVLLVSAVLGFYFFCVNWILHFYMCFYNWKMRITCYILSCKIWPTIVSHQHFYWYAP